MAQQIILRDRAIPTRADQVDQGINQLIGGIQNFAQARADQQQTDRQMALQSQQYKSDLARSGVVLSPEESAQVDSYFKPQSPLSGLFDGGEDQPSLAAIEARRNQALADQYASERMLAKEDRANRKRQDELNQKLNKAKLSEAEYKISQLNLPVEERDAFKEAQLKALKPKPLSANVVRSVAEGKQIPSMLQEVAQTLQKQAGIFGPIEGRIRGLNPYDETAQTVDAQMRAASQSFGRFMEGGVLRKEDEEKYRRMFPNLSDTPEVAKNKLAVVQKLLADKYNTDVNALASSGFDVSGFGDPLPSPQSPVKDQRITGQLAPINQSQQVPFSPTPGIVPSAYAVPQNQPALMNVDPAKAQRLLELRQKAGL